MLHRLRVAALVVFSCAAITACNGQNSSFVQVCVNATSGNRVIDTACGVGDRPKSPYIWFYLPDTVSLPAVGDQVLHDKRYTDTGGTIFKPNGPEPRSGVPAQGTSAD